MIGRLVLPKLTTTIFELPAVWLVNDAELVVVALGGIVPLAD
jgi:hypothetical protein